MHDQQDTPARGGRSGRAGSRAWGWALFGHFTLLFVATHVPESILEFLLPHPPDAEALVHFLGYAGLSFLLAGFLNTRGWRLAPTFVTVVACGLCYAAVDELLQIPVGRTADAWDVLPDAMGIAAALVVARLVLCWNPPPPEPFHISV